MIAPKLQLTDEQPLTGECYIPPKKKKKKKKKPHVQGQGRSPKLVGRAKSHFESNPHTHQRAWRAQTNCCVHQDPGTPKRLRHTCLWVFECLLWRYRQQWPAEGREALAAANLGGSAREPHHRATEQTTYYWRTIIPKKFLNCCKSSRTHNRFHNVGIQYRDWQSPGNLTLKIREIWWQNFQRTGETNSWRA